MSCYRGVSLRFVLFKICIANNRPVWRKKLSAELQLLIPQKVPKQNLAILRQCFVSSNRHFFDICLLLAVQIDIAMEDNNSL